jgi:hypothetical protein
MLLPALSMVCVPTIHCSRIHRPLASSAKFPAILGTGLHRGALDLQGGNHQIVMCRSQLMGREAFEHVLQTAAYAQHGYNAVGVQRVIAACAHKNTDTHTQAYQQGDTAVRDCTVS